MSKKINMLNQVYGMLTVIAEAPSDKSGNAMWECRCECGNIKIIQGRHLRSGNTTSCGCKRIKSLIEYNHTRVKDLTNQKFGKLTALYSIGSNNNKNIIWHCKCECGEECDVASHDLLTGNTKSCGCMRTKSFGDDVILTAIRKNLKLTLRTYSNPEYFLTLKSPNNGSMTASVKETISGKVYMLLEDTYLNKVIFEDTGFSAGIEYGGDFEKFFN